MNVVKRIFLISLIVLLPALIVGATQAGMTTDSRGSMSGCPLMAVPALCHMSPLEHAHMLQNMLTAIPAGFLLAFFVSLLLALSVILFATTRWESLGIAFDSLVRPPPRARASASRHILQEAFASGILNSKAF